MVKVRGSEESNYVDNAPHLNLHSSDTLAVVMQVMVVKEMGRVQRAGGDRYQYQT